MAAADSKNRLFIGSLSWNTDDRSLSDAFRPYGEVENARVVLDRDTGRSRGFGFVTFTTEEAATKAMEAMQGKEVDGRNIRVDIASNNSGGGGRGGRDNRGHGGGRDRDDRGRDSRPYGRSGGGGGYGGGRDRDYGDRGYGGGGGGGGDRYGDRDRGGDRYDSRDRREGGYSGGGDDRGKGDRETNY